jgi:hypothetical protein
MTDWYKVFSLETTIKDVVTVAVEAEDVEEGAVVEAPPVVANGASGAFRVTPYGSEDKGGGGGEGSDEGGEGPGLRDGDVLPDGGNRGGQRYCRRGGRGAPGRRRRCCCGALYDKRTALLTADP